MTATSGSLTEAAKDGARSLDSDAQRRQGLQSMTRIHFGVRKDPVAEVGVDNMVWAQLGYQNLMDLIQVGLGVRMCLCMYVQHINAAHTYSIVVI